jgi:Fur family transcriptional regulator, peroxide stress response regulator
MAVTLQGSVSPAALLREAGLRVTPQRLAIARAVLRRQHPTAAEVFDVVRKQFPTMGLATVYATLNTMTRRGLVRPMPFADAVRFDANVTPHANLICTNCGSITDFEGCDDVLAQLRERTAEKTGFSFSGERLDLHGVCAACSDLQRLPAHGVRSAL